ncbi:P-loop containing nucleoside triphosphate hydrolase protein [Coprinopsis marcescibilis]|uniref:P-loop containing nucleoside triphosphate hydrolase protein n=1 Tax=Coprinopsis marcescibilis TaxID=230819 RepID=A0A5C3LLS1_COPMA|nr:P-loop containing nucleoside triphosphate hydrolase protein [Coprinopsis marcescibilis]
MASEGQHILSFPNGASAGIPGQAVNQTHAAAPTVPPIPATFNLASTLSFLFSFSALRGWLELAILGAIFETARRVLFYVYYKIYDSFFITVFIEDGDQSYDWLLVWISKHPSWKKARDIQISDRSYGLRAEATAIEGEEQDAAKAAADGTRPLNYLPAFGTHFHFWYRRHWVRIHRGVKEGTSYYDRRKEYIVLRLLAWNHDVLNQMLLEAKKEYKAAQEGTVSIYVSNIQNEWNCMTTRPNRPLKSIVLEPGVQDLLLNDARDFLLSKRWYAARGIPFRRGYLLYGAPGTGKTSIIQGIAGELDLDVYIVSLSRAGLDDNGLSSLISDLPDKCIALMEDIDAAFSNTLNRDEDDKTKRKKSGSSSTSKISLSGLLNALDGVGAQEGRILFATTNKYASLDPALCRPGRMDLHIEFHLASKYQARELYKTFYLPDSKANGPASNFASEKQKLAEDSDAPQDEKTALLKEETTGTNHPLAAITPHHLRGPQLPAAEVEELAGAFAAEIPERELSMAALQGYLMTYKTRPHEAVTQIKEWVVKQRLEAAKTASVKAEVKSEVEDGSNSGSESDSDDY